MTVQIMQTCLLVALVSVLSIKFSNEFWDDVAFWIKACEVIPLLVSIPVFFVAAIWHIWA